jgi:hypothetical protein
MSEPNKNPAPLPRDLDETEQRLHAEFYQCDHEHTIAKEKITNPRHSTTSTPKGYAGQSRTPGAFEKNGGRLGMVAKREKISN